MTLSAREVPRQGSCFSYKLVVCHLYLEQCLSCAGFLVSLGCRWNICLMLACEASEYQQHLRGDGWGGQPGWDTPGGDAVLSGQQGGLASWDTSHWPFVGGESAQEAPFHTEAGYLEDNGIFVFSFFFFFFLWCSRIYFIEFK